MERLDLLEELPRIAGGDGLADPQVQEGDAGGFVEEVVELLDAGIEEDGRAGVDASILVSGVLILLA